MNREQPFLMPEEGRLPLEHIAVRQVLPAHSVLFTQGEPVRGVYVIRSGRVALSLPHTPDPARIAGPGSVLGLPATMGAQPYSLTAEALDEVEVGFVQQDAFLALLKQHPAVCFAAMETLATELYDARRQASALLERLPALN